MLTYVCSHANSESVEMLIYSTYNVYNYLDLLCVNMLIGTEHKMQLMKCHEVFWYLNMNKSIGQIKICPSCDQVRDKWILEMGDGIDICTKCLIDVCNAVRIVKKLQLKIFCRGLEKEQEFCLHN